MLRCLRTTHFFLNSSTPENILEKKTKTEINFNKMINYVQIFINFRENIYLFNHFTLFYDESNN